MTNLRQYFTYDECRELYAVTPNYSHMVEKKVPSCNLLFNSFKDVLNFCQDYYDLYFCGIYQSSVPNASLFRMIKGKCPRLYLPYDKGNPARIYGWTNTWPGYQGDPGFYVERITKIYHHRI